MFCVIPTQELKNVESKKSALVILLLRHSRFLVQFPNFFLATSILGLGGPDMNH